MLLIIRKKATREEIEKMTEDFDGYIKVVIDVEQEILTGGGKRHFEGEQKLLEEGSKQGNLWGGGLDSKTGNVDFDSMINVRPNQDNPSREVLSANVREKMEKIIRRLLK